MLVTELGITKLVKEVFDKKASFAMVTTEAGNSITLKIVQPLNADAPIVVNELVGVNITLVKAVQPSNALAPMLVTEAGIVMLVKAV